MTDAEYEAAQAALATLHAESQRLWKLKNETSDAWYAAQCLTDNAKRDIERERQRRAWEAEFRAAAAQETAA